MRIVARLALAALIVGGGVACGTTQASGPATSIGAPCRTNDDCPLSYLCLQRSCQLICGNGLPSCPSGTECSPDNYCSEPSPGTFSGIGVGGSGGGGGAGGSGRGGTAGVTGTGGSGAATVIPSPPTGPGYGDPVAGVAPVADGGACATSSANASVGQLDLFIVQDATGSMDSYIRAGVTKWKMVTDAITSFITDPASSGIGAGIGFFGGADDAVCVVSRYATPAVPIALLNGNAPAILAAIGSTATTGNTPTPPALDGALEYGAQWLAARPSHKLVIVLATDGLPNRYTNAAGTGCSGTTGGVDPIALQRTLDIAHRGFTSQPSIPTYVIGVVAPADRVEGLPNLNQIALAGGTGAAFIVDTAASAGKQFVAAMNAIRTANAIGCRIGIPPPAGGQWVDFGEVTVTYSPGGGAPTPLGWVASAADCTATDAFYYDVPSAPTSINLCPATCSAVEADSNAVLDVSLGCLVPSDAGPPPATGGSGGGASCLLNGQSCTAASQCCSGVCNAAGYCGAIIN